MNRMNARTPSPSGRGNELDFAIFNRILRRKISKRRAPSLEQGEEALLNYALELAIYCSGYWLNQIHERLRQAYPEMRPEGLDRLNRIALAAVKSGQDLVHWM